MIRVLLNGSPIQSGGGLQAICSFILSTLEKNDKDILWNYLISKSIVSELKELGCTLSKCRIIDSPARSKSARLAALKYADQIKPDIVFTFMGPAYIKFNCKHLLGVADGWVTHSTYAAFATLGKFPIKWLQVLSKILYKRFWIKIADEWVVEAECARNGLIKKVNLNGERIHVVPNTPNKVYWDNNQRTDYPDRDGPISILTFSGPYPHKNLDLIPCVARELVYKYNYKSIRFILTLPEDCAIWESVKKAAKRNNVLHYIENRGVIAIANGPSLYNDAHLHFMPTVLETYSAVYPESFLMGLPVVTTDMSFAHDICGAAALYFKPKNYKDAARQIDQLLSSEIVWNKLIEQGRKMRDTLISPENKASCYYKIIRKMANAA